DGGMPGARVRSVFAEIIGVGFGLDGTSARLTIDGDGAPATLVAKWCSAANAEREERFYRTVAPRLELRLAKLFACRIDASSGRVVAARDALSRAPATFVHADLHLDNVLFLDDGAPVILDWTDACRGPGAVDFARLLVECMPSASRRARQDSLSARYVAKLAA